MNSNINLFLKYKNLIVPDSIFKIACKSD